MKTSNRARPLSSGPRASASLPEAVRQLLLRVETYEQLDVFLVVAALPHRNWSLGELHRELGRPREVLQESLDWLVGVGLLHELPAGRWRLAPAADVQRAVPQLLELHQENIVTIVRVLTENALERLRTKALHTFAAAFVLTDRS
jgi:hypothetical protein